MAEEKGDYTAVATELGAHSLSSEKHENNEEATTISAPEKKKGDYTAVETRSSPPTPTFGQPGDSETTLTSSTLAAEDDVEDMEKDNKDPEKKDTHLSVNFQSRVLSPGPDTQRYSQRRSQLVTSRNSLADRQRRQAEQLAKKKRKKKLTIVISAIAGAVVLLIIALGVSLELTVGRKNQSKASNSNATTVYVAPIVNHTHPENDLMVQMFEWNIPKNASHWTTISKQFQNLKILGVKNMWIPPATKNVNRAQIGYDVYDLWDLGEFNAQGNVSTNMGTKKQLQDFTTKAKAAGIGVIYDAVLNQKTGGEATVSCQVHTVNATDRLQVTSDNTQIQAWLKFDYPARNGKYSNKTWSCDDFTAVDFDQTTQKNAIYKIVGSNNDFETDVSQENGNYDYLMLADVAYKNPSVRADVLSWVQWIHSQLSLAGFRLDAAKHLSTSFILEVLNTIRDQNNGTDAFFASEYFTDDVSAMKSYLDALQGRAKMFDTPLLTNFFNYYNGTQTDMGQIFNNSFIAERPSNAVTFVVTHDTQPGQSLSQFYIDGWFSTIAYALILLRQEGLPCLFYGDIYGLYNTGSTSFTPNPRSRIIANLAVARKYWAYGTQTDYFGSQDTVGWTRTGIPGDRPDGLAAIISNSLNSDSLTMNVGKQHAGETWTDVTQNIINQAVKIDADGNGVFSVRGQSVSVWVNQSPAEGRGSLGQWNGDIYGLAPYDPGHATNNYQGAGTGAQGT